MTTKASSLFQAALSELGNNTAVAMLLGFLSSSVGNGPLPNVIFVDGSAPAGGNGSIGAPFDTIAGANAAISQSNTTIVVLPGTYAENVTMPITFTGLALVGLSRRNTTISGVAGAADVGTSVQLAATDATPQSFEIRNLTITRGANAGRPLRITTTSTTGFGGGVILNDVAVISNAANADVMTLTSLESLTMINCTVTGTSLATTAGCPLTNIAGASMRGCTFQDLLISFNTDVGVVPAAGRGSILLTGGTRVTGTLTFQQQADVICDASVRVGNIAGSSLSIGVAVAQAPRFQFHGQQGTSTAAGSTVVITMITPAATPSVYDFTGATFHAAIVSLVAGAAGTQPVNAQGIRLGAAAGVVALTGVGVIALDVRGMSGGAVIPYTASHATHTVDRSKIVANGAAVTAAAKTFTLGTGGTAPFAVEPIWPAGATFAITGTRTDATHTVAPDVLSVTAQSATAFTTGAQTNATTVSFVITRTGS